MIIELAFTTRIPLAVMIAMGIKQWENRAAMPMPSCGTCAMTCSKASDEREYRNFLAWAERVFKPEVFDSLPRWELVEGWRGRLIGICDYEASCVPGPQVWNEGYQVWWHLTHVRLLNEPMVCRGNVGMWRLPEEMRVQLRTKIDNHSGE